MIKAKVNATGEAVEVRPYQTEIYDFMVCRNGGIMGELYMRSELTIIGDNELDFVSLVKRMREAQTDLDILVKRVTYKRRQGIEILDEDYEDLHLVTNKVIALESEIDEYLKKIKECHGVESNLSSLAKPCSNFAPKDNEV